MGSDRQFPIRGMAWLELRRAFRNPGVFVNDLIFGAVSLLVAFHPAAEDSLFITIRVAIYLVIIGIGGIVMAELNAKDPGFMGMLMERGAYREASFALMLAQVSVWQMVILPSLGVRLWRAPESAMDLLPQWLATIGCGLAVAAAVQWITLEATRRDWITLGPWLIPSLVIGFLAVFVSAGLGLLGLADSQEARQWIAVAYGWICGFTLTWILQAVASELPRKQHSLAPGE